MSRIAEAFVDITARTGRLQAGLNDAVRQTREATKKAGGGFEVLSPNALLRGAAALAKARIAIDLARTATKALRGDWQGVVDTIHQLPFGIGAFIQSLDELGQSFDDVLRKQKTMLDIRNVASSAFGATRGIAADAVARLTAISAESARRASLGGLTGNARESQEIANDFARNREAAAKVRDRAIADITGDTAAAIAKIQEFLNSPAAVSAGGALAFARAAANLHPALAPLRLLPESTRDFDAIGALEEAKATLREEAKKRAAEVTAAFAGTDAALQAERAAAIKALGASRAQGIATQIQTAAGSFQAAQRSPEFNELQAIRKIISNGQALDRERNRLLADAAGRPS